MYKTAILFGILLIANGLYGFFNSDSDKPGTALIPAGVGAVILLLSREAGSFMTGCELYVDGGFTGMSI